MSETIHHPVLRELLSRCLGGGDPSLELSEDFVGIIKENRLEGLLYACSDAALSKTWQNIYHQRQLQGLHLLEVAQQFSDSLEEAGVPCFAVRGPVDALWLYGDVAARSYSDIDLYIPPSKVRAAWACAQTFGFTLYHEHMPQGFYVRNHLNWALVQKDLNVMCDLHWAVDHPFQSIRIDYEGVFERSLFHELDGKKFRRPGLEDWLLLTGQHLLKHAPDLTSWVSRTEALVVAADRHLLKYVMDLSFFFKREGKNLDWKVLHSRAKTWQVEEALFCSILLAEPLVQEALPAEVVRTAKDYISAKQPLSLYRDTSKFAELLNRHAGNQGFKFNRLSELSDYCWPAETSSLSYGRRLAHLLVTVPRLLVAGLDTMGCLACASIRKRFARFAPLQKTSVKKGSLQHG